MRFTLAASAVAAAAAQETWGTTGSWELLASVGAGPQLSRWHAAATTGGCVYITGGQTRASGGTGNATFQFDTSSNTWTQLPFLPANFLAPALAAFGGMLVMVGGESTFGASDEVLVLSTTNNTGGWRDARVPGGSSFGPRIGHRVLIFGGVAYLLGGQDGNDPATYYNDVYGMDLNSFLLGTPQADGTPPGWVQLVAPNAPGMVSPRSAFSWDAYGHTTVLFGGIWATTNAHPTDRGLRLFNDAWAFTPGAVTQLGPAAGGGAAGWTQLPTTGQGGGGLPPCRYGHASGVLLDQLYVFGGTTTADGSCTNSASALVPLADLWVLNLPTLEWAQVVPSAPWPGARGVPTGVFVGRHLYIYGGDGASADMWRWAPVFVPAGVGGGGGGAAAATAPGVTAALTITTITSLASLAGTAALWWRGRRATGSAAAAGAGGGASMGDAYARL